MIGRIVRYVRAHHVAFLALFLVLGGGSAYAAATLAPKNSVGSAQVINGSLQTKDLSKKARKALRGARGPRGLRGAAGAQGAQGIQGVKGDKGDKGDTGPSNAFGGFRDPFLDIGSGTTTLGTLPLGAGKYVIVAKQYLNNNGTANNRVACQLAAGSDTDTTPGDITFAGGDGADDRRVVPFMVVHEFTAPGSAVLSCTTPSQGANTVNAAQTKIIAIRVGSLSNTGI
jgi:hypothetical protein